MYEPLQIEFNELGDPITPEEREHQITFDESETASPPRPTRAELLRKSSMTDKQKI